MEIKQRLSGPMLTREMALQPVADTIRDAESRRIVVSFSSEQPVLRASWFDDPWIETLGHNESEVDMSRLESGAPVLHDHERTAHVGVVERAWLENGRGYAEIKLSSRAEVDGLWQDLQEGIVRNTSVGYHIQERLLTRSGDPSEYRVTRWMPMEISLVSVPADASVGVGRGANPPTTTDDTTRFSVTPIIIEEDTLMSEEQTIETRAAPELDAEAIRKQAAQESIKTERKRLVDIMSLARKHSATELGETAITDGATIEQFRAALLDHLASAPENAQEIQRPVTIQPGADQSDKLRNAAVDWLLHRHGQQAVDVQGNPYKGMSLIRLAQDCLERSGQRATGLDAMEIAQRAITHSTSDFSVVLENTMHKELQASYTAVPDVWRTFSAIGSVSDFRPHYRYRMGTFGDILDVGENAEYQDATLSDAERETISAKTKGRILNISRQMIINDDLGAFLGIARMMGRGAARTLEKDWFALLLSGSGNGPTMGDGVALFDAGSHKNVGGTAGITGATLDAARLALAEQMDPDGNDYIGLSPYAILAPSSQYSSMLQLLRSEADPASNNSRKYNPVRDMVQTVISTPRIADHWYLFANPADEPVMEVAFLNGQQSPVMEMQEAFRVDGVSWKIRFDYGIAAVGWRGAVRTAKT